MAEPEYPILKELETRLKLRWVDTDDIMATQRAIIQVEPELAYLELPRGRKGDKGDAGPAISIQGIITADSQLPASAEIGHAYVNTSTKGLAVWNGSSWFKVDNFAGVDADVQQFSRWLAQLESEARRAADAARRAEFAAEETIQQVTGDFATRNYVDDLAWHKDIPDTSWNIEDFPKGIWKVENADQRTRLGLPNANGVLAMHVFSPDRQSVQDAKTAYWLSLSHSSPTRMLIRSTNNTGVWEPAWRNTYDGYEPPSKRAAVPLTFPRGSSYSDDRPTLTIRIPFKFGAAVKRARLRLRNYDYRSDHGFPGSYRIVGAGIGKHQINNDGSMTGLVPEGESVTQLMGSTEMAGPDEAAGDWVDVDLEANTDYLLSYSFTADDGMIYTRQTGQCFTNRLSSGWNRVGSVTSTPSNMSVLAAILDVEVLEDVPIYGYLGDSQTAAISASRPGYDSWAMVHSRLAGAIPTIHGHAGGGLNEWQAASKPAYAISEGMTKFDRFHISMGSNDISGGRPFTGIQEYLTTVMKNWRSQTDTFVLHNYLPRTSDNPTDTVRNELNDWVLNNLPGSALYAVDVYGATADIVTGLMDERWRGSINDVHMNSAGNARVALATLAGTSGYGGGETAAADSAAARAYAARDEAVGAAQSATADAEQTGLDRTQTGLDRQEVISAKSHIDQQVDAIDTAFTESVPPYLQPDSPGGLNARIVSTIHERLPEYTIGPTGAYATVDDFLVDHPTGGAKIVLQAGKHFVGQLPSDGSLTNFVMTGQGSIWGTLVKDPQEVTTVETNGPLIDAASGTGNLRFSDFNLRNLTEENTDHGLRFSYPKGVTVERLNIYGFGGSSIWMAGGLDSEVFDNYIIAKDFSGNNGFAGIHISKLTDDWNSANTTTHLKRNYIGSSGNYGFFFEGVSRGTISTGDIAEGCQVGFHFHRAPITVIAPYTEANTIGMQSLDCSPLIIGATRDELIQEWTTSGVSVFDRGAVRIAEKYIDMGKGITMSMRDGNQSGDFDNSMSIRSGTLEPNGYYAAPAGSMYFMRGGTNGKTLWQKHTNGGNTGWLPIGNFTVSEFEITSASSWLNANKTAGMTVWCHTLNVLVYTERSDPSSPWINVRTGETVATPV